ncbi:MAG: hypothetical protein CXZ00_03115 [Acidobacteria bacterium]|nr:MAG: hypothetical protein CXZ00_03115 [Acidobacteriota bacterium]
MRAQTVLLGYELGSGREVRIPVQHMAVTGITQQSGKTTTLEALIGRSGLRAVTFVTKRDEGAFQQATRIPAYFREHTDWRFVESLLEALLQQKMKFERSWIMRVCKGTKTLREIQKNLEVAMRDATRGLDESVYFTLSEYFEQLIPEIERLPYSKELKLGPGINVVDVSQYSTHLQGLVIRSVLEWVYEREKDVITLIPEAWEFVPQRHNSPVKDAAVQLIRKGAAGGKYVWLDSQDLAGVDKEIIKQVSVYVLGVQREVNEVKRTLAHLPGGARRLKPEQIMKLSRGWFYVSYGSELRCVYVQPAWLDADPERAKRFAIEELPASYVAKPETKRKAVHETKASTAETITSTHETKNHTHKTNPAAHEMETPMRPSIEEYREDIKSYATLVEYVTREFPDDAQHNGEFKNPVDVIIELLSELKNRRMSQSIITKPEPAEIDYSAVATEVLERLKASPEFTALQVRSERPELNVTVQRRVIDVDGSTLRGRTAQLIAAGWFDSPRRNVDLLKELHRRGFASAPPNISRELNGLAELGFLTKEGEGYQAVPGMKVNIHETEA